jgi:gas vesicle protein
MARHDDDDDDDGRPDRRGSAVVPFLWGLAVGAVAALLLAPMSGEDLRAELGSRSRKLKDLASQKAEELGDLVEGGYEKARARVEEGLDSAKRTVAEGRHVAHDVADAGRDVAQTAREELERRLTEAREARRGSRRGSHKDEDPDA